jgi:hypothetical protein
MRGVEQVHVQVTPWLSHVFRLYDGDRHLEFEWKAGPLPTHDGGMQVMTLMLIHCQIIMMRAVEFITIVIVHDDGNDVDYTLSADRNNHSNYIIGTTTRRH